MLILKVKLLFCRTKSPMTLKLGIQYLILEYYKLFDDHGLTVTVFITGSNLFPNVSALGESLYSMECSCISKFVLIQHILGTQVSDTRSLVLWY